MCLFGNTFYLATITHTLTHLYPLVRVEGPFTLGLALLVKDQLLQGAKKTELRRIIKNRQ